MLGVSSVAEVEEFTQIVCRQRCSIRQQVSGWKQSHDANQATSMIGLRMCHGHEIKTADIVIPQHRGDHPSPNLEASVIGSSTIDQKIVVAGSLYENSVSRADI